MKIPAPVNSVRLGHIIETSLYSDDLDRAEDFYKSVLGMKLLAKEPGRHAFFKHGRQMLLIFNPVKTMEASEAAPHGAHGPGHVAFAVPMAELDRWSSYLQERGVPIEKDVTWPGGARSLYFRDPAGNCLELTSPLLWGMPDDSAHIVDPAAAKP